MFVGGVPVAALAGRRLVTGGAWTPLASAALNDWFDTTSGITQAGGSVSSWVGRKGSAFTQATAANQPGFSATAINEIPGFVIASGSPTMMNTSLLSTTLPLTIASVISVPSTGTKTIIGAQGGSGIQLRIANSTPDVLKEGLTDLGSGGSVPTSTPCVVLTSYDGTTLTIRVSGVTTLSKATSNTLSGSYPTTLFSNNNTGEFFVGSCGDIVKDGSTPSLALQQKLEGFLAWKYGIQATLPAAHPYYSRAPLTSDP